MRFIISQSLRQDRPLLSLIFLLVLVFAAILFQPTIAWTRPTAFQTIQYGVVKPGSTAEEAPPSGQPKLPLLVSPSSMGISVGDPQEMRLTDSTGRPVEGATWSIEDPSIAQLQAGRFMTVVGLSPGTTTLTATWNGQTVRAKVHVLGAAETTEARRMAAEAAASYEPKLNPSLARKVTSVGDAYFHYRRGLEFFDAGDLQSAYDEYTEALRQKPDFADAQTKLAYTLWKAGSADGAIVAAKHALKLNPNNPEAEKTIGLSLVNQGDFNGAIAHYKEALRMMPDYVDAHYDIGIAFGKIGDHASAIREYREALRLAPDKQEAHYNLARELHFISDLAGAVAENRESVRLAPTKLPALLNLANSLYDAKDFEDAGHYYQAAIDVEPSVFAAHWGLGLVLMKMQDWEGAARENSIAVDIAPRDYDAWCNLGIALLNSKEEAAALKALTRAHELAPTNPRVQTYYDQAVRASQP